MNFLRRHAFIVALLVVIGAARFAILFASQTHVHSDEAIIGLMGKHIAEGRYFPFYMYGQPYNAGASGEAYLAAIPFKLFGVGVIALKSVIVVLSLFCLLLFYRMVRALYDERVANFAAIAFAVAPSLLKWHFQVRGYSFYFLSIPVLLICFGRIASMTRPKTRDVILFGIVSGLSVWCLELSLTLIAALWILLLLARKMSILNGGLALAGFVAGYAPAIVYNFTHSFANWQTVFENKTGGAFGNGLAVLARPANFYQIFGREMPKFFGSDTVLWYYPERPWIGFVFYAVAIVAITAALWPFIRRPEKIRALFSRAALDTDHGKDVAMVAMTSACAVPYLVAPIPTASYFLGGIFFLSILTGRLVAKCFASATTLSRAAGALITMSILTAGIGAMIRVAQRNEIETLTLCDGGNSYCMARIPGADIDRVERHLSEHHITSAWTTVSFTYPLLFETCETVAIADEIFGWKHNVFPPAIPAARPSHEHPPVFIIESDFPMRHDVEEKLNEAAGAPPLVAEYGTLAVIEQR